MTMNRRYSDQDGLWAKLHWLVCQPIIMSILGSSLVIFIVWVSGVFSAFPTTYAQKTELAAISLRQLSDYRDLEARKLNKEDYIREHELLRQEVVRGFDKLDKTDEKILNAILSVRSNQITQYKKQNEEKRSFNN